MEVTLTRFVHALRSAEMPVSPAETLDAFAVVQQVGIDDPYLLQNALSLTLAKTREEKLRFAECFERFFHQLAFQQPTKKSMLKNVDPEELQQAVATSDSEVLTEVVREILHGERNALAWRVQGEAEAMNISGMQNLREKSRMIDSLMTALGLAALSRLIDGDDSRVDSFKPALRYLRQYVQEQVRAYVDAQYQIHVDASGKRALLESALKGNLSHLPPGYYNEVDRVVHKLADRLAQQHRRKRKRTQRGVLDIKHTIRDNVAYDGALFKLRWRQKKIEK